MLDKIFNYAFVITILLTKSSFKILQHIRRNRHKKYIHYCPFTYKIMQFQNLKITVKEVNIGPTLL